MKNDKTIDNLFEQIDEHEIFLFAKAYANVNETFAEKLKKRFKKQLPSKDNLPSKAELTKEIAKCFSHYHKNPSYNRYQSWEPNLLDWNLVGRDIQRINRQLEILVENESAELAVDMAILLLDRGGECYDQEWEYEVEVDYEDLHADDTFNLIRSVFENDKIGTPKKLDICEKLEELAHCSAFDDIDISGFIDETRNVLLSDDDRIALRREKYEKANGDYARESAARDLWDYLIQLGRENEAVAFFEKNRELSNLREKYIDWLVDHRRLSDALKVIDEGLTIHKQYDGIIYNLECRKLALLEQMDDIPSIIKQTTKLFLEHNSSTMTYYHKLKKLISPEVWPNELRALIKKQDFGESAISYLAEIYNEEKWYADLFQLQKESRTDLLSGISRYARNFTPEQQHALVHRLEPVFRDMARNPSPRKYYRELADKLTKLRMSCPPGAELVKRLVAEFRIKYRNRPAMIDELKKF